MNNERWFEIVSYVTERLKSEADFTISHDSFFSRFGLTADDEHEIMMRLEEPVQRTWEMTTSGHGSLRVIVFRRKGR